MGVPRLEPVGEEFEPEVGVPPVFFGEGVESEADIFDGLCKTEECETCKQFDKRNIKIVTVLRTEGK